MEWLSATYSPKVLGTETLQFRPLYYSATFLSRNCGPARLWYKLKLGGGIKMIGWGVEREKGEA